MWRRLRRVLVGDVERRLAELEGLDRPPGPDELRHQVEELVHRAVDLNQTVLARQVDELTSAVGDLRAGLAGNRQHTEAAVAAVQVASVAAAREHTEAAVEVAVATLTRRIHQLRRAQQLTPPATAAPSSGSAVAPEGPAPALPVDPALYVALEERFRGEPALIEQRQRQYLPYLDGIVDASHPALDLGSGRGEWLGLLAERELPAVGVDSNPLFVAECREAGLEVVEGDLVQHLLDRAPGSLGAVTLFQVVEHLPFDVLVTVLAAAARALRPGGVLLAETPNALNLRVAASTFWIDPTHQRPLHPDVLAFLALESGFATVEQRFANRIGDPEPDLSGLPAPAAQALRRLLDQVDGAGDFCLVARTGPGAASAL